MEAIKADIPLSMNILVESVVWRNKSLLTSMLKTTSGRPLAHTMLLSPVDGNIFPKALTSLITVCLVSDKWLYPGGKLFSSSFLPEIKQKWTFDASVSHEQKMQWKHFDSVFAKLTTKEEEVFTHWSYRIFWESSSDPPPNHAVFPFIHLSTAHTSERYWWYFLNFLFHNPAEQWWLKCTKEH